MEQGIVLNEYSLFDYLKSQNMPVLETSLLRRFFTDAKSFREIDFNVVQMHFILYHNLYKLAHSLRDSYYLLYINYIYIYLLEKPKNNYCPYFYEGTLSFCFSKKDKRQRYCSYHLEKEKSLRKKGWLRAKGVEEYYLDFSNFDNLGTEYKSIKNKAKKIKKYSLVYGEIKKSYSTLGVRYSDSIDLIKLRYKKLAKEYHPDINQCSKGYYKFVDITKAYHNIKDFLDSR